MVLTAEDRARWSPLVLSVLRVVVALLFLQHGLSKLLGWPAPAPAAMQPVLFALAAAIETAGSLLLLAGLYTRPVAFIMSGEMAVAYFMLRPQRSFFPYLNGGETEILFAFAFLYLALVGGGPWSLDHRRPRPPSALQQAWTPRLLAVLRVVAALLFLQHGLTKFFGWPGPQSPNFHLFSLSGLGGAIEIVGGVLVALGLFTRPAAFIMSGEMAVAYFMSHQPRGLFPIENRGEGAILYCFIFLYLAIAGPGAWSLDRRRGNA
jgi:putative oxidoreductase